MGVRKRERALEIKEAKKSLAFAKLNNCPTSPRKMRLVADLVRGVEVEKALAILKFNQKEAAYCSARTRHWAAGWKRKAYRLSSPSPALFWRRCSLPFPLSRAKSSR